MGDRIGPRRVLTRIVLWWSAFTSRDRVGIGLLSTLICSRGSCSEAGRSGRVSKCRPSSWRAGSLSRNVAARSESYLMAAQLGGALAPLVVVPIQSHYGWRACFYLFGDSRRWVERHLVPVVSRLSR